MGRELAELIVPPAFREAHRRGMAHYLATGEGPVLGKRIEITGMRAGGEEFPVELAITPIPLEGETLLTATLRDIGRRKQAEEALRLANDELEMRVEERTAELNRALRWNEMLLECAGEGIFGLDLSGRTVFANSTAARLVGWSQEELIGMPIRDLMRHAGQLLSPFPMEECLIDTCLRDGTPHHGGDEAIRRKDGSTFPVEYISKPLWEDGRLTGAVVTFRDVTDRKQAEEQLHASKDMLQLIMDNIPHLIFWKDTASFYLGCNRNFAQAAELSSPHKIVD